MSPEETPTRRYAGIVPPSGTATPQGIYNLAHKHAANTRYAVTLEGTGLKLVTMYPTIHVASLLLAVPVAGQDNTWDCQIWCVKTGSDSSVAALALEIVRQTEDPFHITRANPVEASDGRAFQLGMTADGVALWIFGELITSTENKYIQAAWKPSHLIHSRQQAY